MAWPTLGAKASGVGRAALYCGKPPLSPPLAQQSWADRSDAIVVEVEGNLGSGCEFLNPIVVLTWIGCEKIFGICERTRGLCCRYKKKWRRTGHPHLDFGKRFKTSRLRMWEGPR